MTEVKHQARGYDTQAVFLRLLRVVNVVLPCLVFSFSKLKIAKTCQYRSRTC